MLSPAQPYPNAAQTAAQGPANRRIDEIEFLRAVAIIYTMVAHATVLFGWYGAAIDGFQRSFNLGSGVDLFFVISGFVITRSFLRRPARERGGFGSAAFPFWIRRAFRILPAAWFWLAFSLIGAAHFYTIGVYTNYAAVYSDARAAFFQVANFHGWFCGLNMAVCADGGIPNGIYWTLSLEEQFYFLFPLTMLLLPRKFLVPVLATVALAQMSLVRTSGILVLIRCDGLIVGVLLALASELPAYQKFEPRFLARPALRLTFFYAMLIGIAFFSAQNFQPTARGHGLALAAVIGGLWVFVASFDKGYAFPKSQLDPILMWIGSRSYALYLCHFSAYCVTQEMWFRLGRLGLSSTANFRYSISAAVLLFVFAEGTYRYIEMPFRRMGYRVAADIARIEQPVI